MTKHERINKLKTFVRNPYVWPGGYTQIMLASDGGGICHKCVKENFRQILESTKNAFLNDDWAFEDTFINWDDVDLHCDHCSERMPAEYEDSVEELGEQMREETLKHQSYEDEIDV